MYLLRKEHNTTYRLAKDAELEPIQTSGSRLQQKGIKKTKVRVELPKNRK